MASWNVETDIIQSHFTTSINNSLFTHFPPFFSPNIFFTAPGFALSTSKPTR
jgi:hypothetical protein